MLQTLLAKRYKLSTHQLTKRLPVYTLTVSPRGSRLVEIGEGAGVPNMPNPPRPPGAKIVGSLHNRGTVQDLADELRLMLDRPVLDRTGLSGRYLFSVTRFSNEEWNYAVESQLGLRLNASKQNVPVLVVDHIEKPTID